MKAKYLLEAIAALRAADEKISYMASQISPYQAGHLRLAQECSHIANMLEVASGLQAVEITVEPTPAVREQYELALFRHTANSCL